MQKWWQKECQVQRSLPSLATYWSQAANWFGACAFERGWGWHVSSASSLGHRTCWAWGIPHDPLKQGWQVDLLKQFWLTSMHGILSITSYHFILLQPVPTVSRLPPVPRACMEISSETRFLVRYPGPPEIWLFRYQSGSCAPPHSKTQALVFRGQTNYWELRGNTIDDLEIISSATYTSPTISVFGKELLVKFFGKEPIRKQLAKQTFSQYFRKSCQEIMRTIYCWTSCRNWYHQNPSNLRDETRPSCLLRWPQQTVEACAWAAQCELLDSSKSIVGICASMNLHYTMSLSLVK